MGVVVVLLLLNMPFFSCHSTVVDIDGPDSPNITYLALPPKACSLLALCTFTSAGAAMPGGSFTGLALLLSSGFTIDSTAS